MKYLFDTDSICNLLKKKPSAELSAKIQNLEIEQQFISTITVMEIVYGAFKSDKKEFHLNNLEKILLPNVNILGFDLKSSYVCGKIQAELADSGNPLYLADMQIASIAIANGMTLVSGNIKHFQRIKSLAVENWL